jgi:hypothetical protein
MTSISTYANADSLTVRPVVSEPFETSAYLPTLGVWECQEERQRCTISCAGLNQLPAFTRLQLYMAMLCHGAAACCTCSSAALVCCVVLWCRLPTQHVWTMTSAHHCEHAVLMFWIVAPGSSSRCMFSIALQAA